MKQFSTTGEGIEIEIITGELFFIDPLYLGKIATTPDRIKNTEKSRAKEYIKWLEKEFFPFGGGTLIGYKLVPKDTGIYSFDLKSMKLFDEDNEELESQSVQKNITSFGVDSGSFLIIDWVNFQKIFELVKFDDLLPDQQYFDNINQQLGNKGWGYVLSPGIDSGYVFEGDGSYLVE
ncbi:MAG: hypothetical protein ABIT05_05555 [Chitinophagaceae bacterium]